MKILAAPLLALLFLAPTATAGGLQKGRVPSTARWLAHLDVEAMKGSKLYELVRQASSEDGSGGIDEGIAHVRMFAGLDPTMDLQSVTLYCATKSEQGCVALLAGNAKIDQAIEKLRTSEAYHTTPAQGYALHTWGGDHDTWHAYVFRKEGSEERVVVASQDADELVRGIAVLEGRAESLAGAGRPAIAAVPASGSILFAAAGEGLAELGDVEPVSAVAKLAKSFAIDIGEDRGALRVHAVVDTRTPEDAQRIHQVLQGAVALVGLAGVEHEEAASKIQPLVDALRFTVSNSRVDADFRYDVQSLMEDLKSLKDLDEDHGAKREVKKHVHRHRRENEEEDK